MPDVPRAFPWRVALAQSSDALFVAGRSRRIRYANPAFERLTGKATTAWRGMRLSRLLSAGLLGQVLAIPPEVWAGERATVRRSPPDAPTGLVRWEVHFLPIRGATEVRLVLGHVRILQTEPPAATFAIDLKLQEIRSKFAESFAWDDWEAPSPAARKLLSRARFIASTSVPVWLTGATGVGKHRLARTIHAQGPSRQRAFVRIDGSAVQPYLVDVQLFGKGSLAASGQVGTLYLSDPAALGSELRAKLLAWLAMPHAPRLITGADRPAAELVADRRIEPAFEAELSVLELAIPSLGARPDDLAHYCQLWTDAHALPPPDRSALTVLASHDWPGNVRELYASLASAAQHAAGRAIVEADLPQSVRAGRSRGSSSRHALPQIPLAQLLATVERKAIERAIADGGHPAAAARRLGITREALRRRAIALGVSLPGKDDPA